MSDRKPCIRCGRAIDAFAKLCVYCNWDQSVAAPPPTATVAAEPAATGALVAAPNPALVWKRRAIFGGALLGLALLAFLIGAFVHRESARPLPHAANDGLKDTPTADVRTPRSDITLVPVPDGAPIEAPVTSAPISDMV